MATLNERLGIEENKTTTSKKDRYNLEDRFSVKSVAPSPVVSPFGFQQAERKIKEPSNLDKFTESKFVKPVVDNYKNLGSALVSGAGNVNTGVVNTLKTLNKPVSYLGSKIDSFVSGKDVKPYSDPISKGLTSVVEQQEKATQPYQDRLSKIEGPEKYVYNAVQSIPQIAPAIASGGGSIGLGAIGATAFGGGAREAEKEGASTLQQFLAGGASAGVEVATEAIPLEKMVKLFNGKGGVVDVAKNAIFEFMGESTAEAAAPFIENIYNANAAKEAYTTDLAQTVKQIVDAGITGATASFIIGGSAMGINTQEVINNPTPENIEKVKSEIETKIQSTSFGEQDLTQPSGEQEFMNQSTEGAEFNLNKSIMDRLSKERESQPNNDIDDIFAQNGLPSPKQTIASPTTELQQQPDTIARPIEETVPMASQQAQTVEPIKQNTANRITEPITTLNEDMGLDEMASFTMMPEKDIKLKTPKPLGEPIDTTTRVLTETPKTKKVDLGKKLERAYQEIFSKNIPLERIGGDTAIQGSNLNRTQGTIEYNTVGKQTDMQGQEIGNSIVNIFSTVNKVDKKALFDYSLNKHNIDRYAEGKPVFGETVTSEVSQQKVNDYEQNNPNFAQTNQEIVKYFNNLLNEWSVKSGLVSQETADMLSEKYKNYVPTFRAKDLPKSMLSSNQNIAQVIKKAKGGEDFILPIDQSMIAMTDRVVKNARKNELMNTLAEAYEDGNTNVDRYIKSIKDLETENIDDLLDIGNKYDEEPVIKGDDYVVNFYTDGQPRQMTVDKTLYNTLNSSVSKGSIDEVGGIVKKYATQPFKNLITGYNPIFAASNIMRDIPTALAYSDNPLSLIKNVPKAVKQMLTNGKDFQTFKAMGGTREGLIGSGKEFKVPTMQEGNKVLKNAKKLNPIKTIGDINNFTETLPRFSEFISVLEKTGNPAQAVYKSAELTTDFSRHGNLTKSLDSFVPYLNPSVQGIDKFARSMIKNPVKTTIKGGLAITLPTMILDMINSDDDDYNELTPRERNLYFNVPFEDKNGDKKFLRIPKSRELGVAFSSIYEWSARSSRGQEVTGEEIAQTIAENFTPADINSPIWTPALKAWKQIQDPDAYETNYWGGLIVPSSQRKYSPGEQYDATSSGIAKAIGQQFEISPYVVDYMLKSYGGIVSQVAQPIGRDKQTNVLTPLLSKFVNDPTFKSATIGNFYDTLDKAKKEAQDFNKQNNVPSKIVTPLERKANYLAKVSTQLSKVRETQRIEQQKKNNDAKVKELQQAMNQIAKDAIERVESDD